MKPRLTLSAVAAAAALFLATDASAQAKSDIKSDPNSSSCTENCSDAGYAWAGLFFVEEGALTLGPEAGVADDEHRMSVPVRWQGDAIAELAVDGAAADDTASLERIAELIAGQCLVGWDTGGEPWES